MKNILILSSNNPKKTSGIVAKDISESLSMKDGFCTQILVKDWNDFNDKRIVSVNSRFSVFAKRVYRKILRMLNLANGKKTNPDYYVLTYNPSKLSISTSKLLHKIEIKPDVIIVLFMHEFVSFRNLFELQKSTGAIIILYMMDMAPFTGGCHFAWECNGYTKKCGNCPAYFSSQEQDQSRSNWLFKKEYIDKMNIIAVAGSEGLYRQLNKSSLFQGVLKEKVLLPINENQFRPSNKVKSREALGLPVNKKLIFFGAVSVSEKRKGHTELVAILNSLRKLLQEESEYVELVVAGRGGQELAELLPFKSHLVGHLSHSELSIAFDAVDLLVSPSIEDSGPMMINQAMMCSTPVVAFDIGVASDMIIQSKTGYSSELGDVDSFASYVYNIITMPEDQYKIMSSNCRDLGLKKTSYSAFINNFNALMDDI
jgi:glycosyltransferase involved in cell wall biosynthesis